MIQKNIQQFENNKVEEEVFEVKTVVEQVENSVVKVTESEDDEFNNIDTTDMNQYLINFQQQETEVDLVLIPKTELLANLKKGLPKKPGKAGTKVQVAIPNKILKAEDDLEQFSENFVVKATESQVNKKTEHNKTDKKIVEQVVYDGVYKKISTKNDKTLTEVIDINEWNKILNNVLTPKGVIVKSIDVEELETDQNWVKIDKEVNKEKWKDKLKEPTSNSKGNSF